MADQRTDNEYTQHAAATGELDPGGRTASDADLSKNAQVLANIIAAAMDGIVTVNEAQRVVFFNVAAEKIFGVPTTDAIGQPLERFIPERFRHAHRTHFGRFADSHVSRRQMGSFGTIFGIRANGEEFPIEAMISQTVVDGERLFTVFLRDISERKSLEEQFLRAQRMESIGTLAGGIAHDLNNVLAPILMAVALLQKRTDDEASLRLLELLRANAERGADMIKQVLSFARGVQSDRLALQAKYLIYEIAKILKETFPRNIEIHTLVKEDPWLVAGDITQLHQVLMNLCINARDAMPNGGALRFEIQNIRIDETYAHMNADATTGPHIQITVSDTGHGIAPEAMKRIFEPFYTTKEHSKGTGLGLSTALGIVRSHGGFINVDSEPGKGTQFKIYLPAIECDETASSEEANTGFLRGNGELILVVDDEASIREISRRVLEAFGYNVVVANDGTEALAMYAKHGAEIAVVVTDMMMPFLDGLSTIRALQRLNPDVRVIASSGLSENRNDAELASLGVKTFLAKPYTAGALLQALSEAVNR